MIKVNIQSSILIDEGIKIYFDPLKMDKKYDADYIFITHSHYDHFSKEDILNLKNDNTVIICPYDIYNLCVDMGFKDSNIVKIKPLDEIDSGVFKFKAVYAYNINKPFHPKENNWVGYVLDLYGKHYYIAGDTDLLEENLPMLNDIDYAFVPIGGTYTMDALEASQFVNLFKPKTVIPIHYGMVVGDINDLNKFVLNVDNSINVLDLLKK